MRSTNPKQRNDSKICRILRLLRFVLGYSQEDMKTILSEQYDLNVKVADMERGTPRPSIDLLYAYEDLTGIPAWAIVWLSEDQGYYLPPDPDVIKGYRCIKLEFCPPIVQGLSMLVNLSEQQREAKSTKSQKVNLSEKKREQSSTTSQKTNQTKKRTRK